MRHVRMTCQRESFGQLEVPPGQTSGRSHVFRAGLAKTGGEQTLRAHVPCVCLHTFWAAAVTFKQFLGWKWWCAVARSGAG